MQHVTNNTAILLKARGFQRPEIKAGQYWYTFSDLEALIIADNVGVTGSHGFIINKETALRRAYVFVDWIYAPTAVDLLELLPDETLAGIKDSMWSVMPGSSPMVFTHRNLAEAAAMAWLALNKYLTI